MINFNLLYVIFLIQKICDALILLSFFILMYMYCVVYRGILFSLVLILVYKEPTVFISW